MHYVKILHFFLVYYCFGYKSCSWPIRLVVNLDCCCLGEAHKEKNREGE